MVKKGWKGEPARHSLAARGMTTKYKNVNRAMSKDYQVTKQSLSAMWKEVKPLMEESVRQLETFEGSERERDKLEEGLFDLFVDLAIIAITRDDPKIIGELETMSAKLPEDPIANARELVADDFKY